MVALTAAVDLLKAFGDTLGLPPSAFGPSGQCQIGFDEISLAIEYRDEAEAYVIEAEVGSLPKPETSAFYARLLELNSVAARLRGGGLIGIDRSTESILFFRQRPAEGMTVFDLEAFVQQGLEGVETWRAWLAAAGGPIKPAVPPAMISESIIFRA